MTVTTERSVEEFTASPRKLFIDGKWVDAASGKTFETPDPATGEILPRGRRRRRGHRSRRRAPRAGPSKTAPGAG